MKAREFILSGSLIKKTLKLHFLFKNHDFCSLRPKLNLFFFSSFFDISNKSGKFPPKKISVL